MRRKTKRVLLIISLILLVALGVLAKEYKDNDFMRLSAAKERWGHSAFDAKKFSSGDAKSKASMVVSLIESKQLIGEPTANVRKILGEYSGHYWGDEIPTYIIEEGWETNQDTWQIIFIPDKSKKVKEIKIHKNCCDR